MASPQSDHERRSATGSEFDEALLQAELLLRQADGSRLAALRYRAATAASWVGSAVVIAVLMAAGTGALWVKLVAAVVVLVANGILALTAYARVITPLMEAYRRDERCASGTVGLLRELLPFVSRDESWTLFRIEQAKLRFSRFPVQGGRL